MEPQILEKLLPCGLRSFVDAKQDNESEKRYVEDGLEVICDDSSRLSQGRLFTRAIPQHPTNNIEEQTETGVLVQALLGFGSQDKFLGRPKADWGLRVLYKYGEGDFWDMFLELPDHLKIQGYRLCGGDAE